MKYLALLLRIGLVVLFLMAGFGKVIASTDMVNNFNNWGLPLWTMYLTGGLEILLALGLVTNLLVRVSALALSLMMIVAVFVHIFSGENFLMPLILVFVGLFVARYSKRKAKEG